MNSEHIFSHSNFPGYTTSFHQARLLRNFNYPAMEVKIVLNYHNPIALNRGFRRTLEQGFHLQHFGSSYLAKVLFLKGAIFI